MKRCITLIVLVALFVSIFALPAYAVAGGTCSSCSSTNTVAVCARSSNVKTTAKVACGNSTTCKTYWIYRYHQRSCAECGFVSRIGSHKCEAVHSVCNNVIACNFR